MQKELDKLYLYVQFSSRKSICDPARVKWFATVCLVVHLSQSVSQPQKLMSAFWALTCCRYFQPRGHV